MTIPDKAGGRIRFGSTSNDRAGAPPFGPAGALGGVLILVFVVGGLCWSAGFGPPLSAARPSLFTGSAVLEDTRPLTVVNLATAQVTVRLEGVNAQVGAAADGDVQPVPVEGGTVLVNRVSGNFNFLGTDDYVTDPDGPGVGLGPLDGSTGALGLASGPDAYILRVAPNSTVSLVDRDTVAQAARRETVSAPWPPARPATVAPLGFSRLGGRVTLQPGAAVVSGRNAWVLVARAGACRVVELEPVAASRPGPAATDGLAATDRGTSPSCDRAALESGVGVVGLAAPGRVRVYRRNAGPVDVAVPSTADAARILPVTGATAELWYLADDPGGWRLFGVGPTGRIAGPYALAGLAAGADPVAPVLSAGFLYTLDQSQAGPPTLWTIDVINGRMAPLRGRATYPLRNSSERPSFRGTQLLVDGPRVVFNDPESLEAVVVFTDGSRSPVVVDKSQAVVLSATGPADLAPEGGSPPSPTKRAAGGSPLTTPIPAVQPVSQQVRCATTTQKPYAPQITGITPSSSAALIQWSYQLLDQTDCEPDTWTVQVRALSSPHQPAEPLRIVAGQSQYLFEGLRPATTYQAVVDAVINHLYTASTPVTFTTAGRGPDAPLSVHTRSDGNGDWVVSWVPCDEAARPDCVVPADVWTVIGAACGGSFVGTPPSIQVAGGQDSATIRAADLGLLGDSLSFTVQGSLASGLVGDPTGDGSCTEAFQRPDPAAITLKGQAVPDPTSNTITATLTVEASGDPGTVFGVPAAEAEFVYTLSGPSGARSVGPTSRASVVVTGLPPGVTFAPSVLIYPAGHPEASATVTGPPLEQTLAWPGLSPTEATAAVEPPAYNQGRVTVTLPAATPPGPLSAVAPTSAEAPGTGPQIQCGGPGGALLSYPVQPLGPDRRLTFPMNDLVDEGGSCAVTFSLSDGADPDPYGGPSPPITAAFDIGRQPAYGFSFTFLPCEGMCPLAKPYTIEVDADDAFGGGGDWRVTTRDPHLPSQTDPCYSQTGDATMPDRFDVTVPRGCIQPDQLTVAVGWRYLGAAESVTAGATNSPPTTTPPPASTTTTTSSTTTAPSSTTTSSTTTGPSSTTTAPSSATTSTTVEPCAPTSTAGTSPGSSTSACVPATESSSGSSASAPVLGNAAAGTGAPLAVLGVAWGVGCVRRRTGKARKGPR